MTFFLVVDRSLFRIGCSSSMLETLESLLLRLWFRFLAEWRCPAELSFDDTDVFVEFEVSCLAISLSLEIIELTVILIFRVRYSIKTAYLK